MIVIALLRMKCYPSLCMRNILAVFRPALLSLTLGLIATGAASADDHFALAVGSHDTLMIFGPKGETVAQLPVPSISTTVNVGATSFQVSYGRDANDLLTAIIAPNPAQPQDLHFNVLNKSIDANSQAVVTLTFSSTLNHVSVDPGYVGSVAVNSETMHHHDLADASEPATPYVPRPARHTHTEVASTDVPASHPAPAPAPAPVERPASVEADSLASAPPPARASALAETSASSPQPGSPSTGEDQPTADGTVLPAPQFAPTPHSNQSDVAGGEAVASNGGQPLYWSEPITPPDGPPPTVGMDQMKLVEVRGPVTLELPNGGSQTATEGALIPSGATVKTDDGASAAVFMGGVNSARLMPDSEAQVSQSMAGSTRHTHIDLQHGTVFSRVGHREGERQDFEVRTPEGVAAARGTQLVSNRHDGHTYLGVGDGTVLFSGPGIAAEDVSSNGDTPGVAGSYGTTDAMQVIIQALIEAQPFNVKLNAALADVASGHATSRERAFVRSIIHIMPGGAIEVYDPDHPLGFMQPISSFTGYGDGVHTTIGRPQDYQYPNPFLQYGPSTVPQNLQPYQSAPLSPH